MKRTLACPRACVALSDNFGVYEITKSKTAATWHDTAMRTYRVRQNGDNQIEMIDLPQTRLIYSIHWSGLQLYLKRLVAAIILSVYLSLSLSRKKRIDFRLFLKKQHYIGFKRPTRRIDLLYMYSRGQTSLKSCRWSRLKVHVFFFAILMRRTPAPDSHDANRYFRINTY